MSKFKLYCLILILLFQLPDYAYALNPAALVAIIPKVMRANVARTAAVGKVHKGAVILANQRAAELEAMALINRARYLGKPVGFIGVAAPSIRRSHSWLLVAIALGVTAKVLNDEKDEVRVTAMPDLANVSIFDVQAFPTIDFMGSFAPQVNPPLGRYIETCIGIYVPGDQGCLSRFLYESPRFATIEPPEKLKPFDPKKTVSYQERYKYLPSSGYLMLPAHLALDVDALKQTPVSYARTTNVLHCYNPRDCLDDFVSSHGFNSNKYKNMMLRISPVFSDPIQENNPNSPFFGSFYTNYRFTFLFTDSQGSTKLQTVSNFDKPKLLLIQKIRLHPRKYEDLDTMMVQEPLLDNLHLTPELLAELINRLWSQSIISGAQYYDYLNPVTVDDVKTALGNDFVPLKDLTNVSPVLKSTSQTIDCDDITVMCHKPAKEKDGLGIDPNIPLPELEKIPTVQMILDPIFSLFPTVRNFKVGAHSSECKTVKFTALNTEFIFSSHCQITESTRYLWALFMLVFWSFLSFRIVMKA
jgi:hypothetical protein